MQVSTDANAITIDDKVYRYKEITGIIFETAGSSDKVQISVYPDRLDPLPAFVILRSSKLFYFVCSNALDNGVKLLFKDLPSPIRADGAPLLPVIIRNVMTGKSILKVIAMTVAIAAFNVFCNVLTGRFLFFFVQLAILMAFGTLRMVELIFTLSSVKDSSMALKRALPFGVLAGSATFFILCFTYSLAYNAESIVTISFITYFVLYFVALFWVAAQNVLNKW